MATEPDETVAWQLDGAAPALHLVGVPEQRVRIEYRVALGWREVSWTDGPYTLDETGAADVTVTLPAEAFVHDAATDYLCDLIAFVSFGGMRRSAPPAYVVWPDGATGSPVVMDLARQRVDAANGVVRDELRVTTDPDTRLVPDVGARPVDKQRRVPSTEMTDSGLPR